VLLRTSLIAQVDIYHTLSFLSPVSSITPACYSSTVAQPWETTQSRSARSLELQSRPAPVTSTTGSAPNNTQPYVVLASADGANVDYRPAFGDPASLGHLLGRSLFVKVTVNSSRRLWIGSIPVGKSFSRPRRYDRVIDPRRLTTLEYHFPLPNFPVLNFDSSSPLSVTMPDYSNKDFSSISKFTGKENFVEWDQRIRLALLIEAGSDFIDTNTSPPSGAKNLQYGIPVMANLPV
jgi:hypothetical protein